MAAISPFCKNGKFLPGLASTGDEDNTVSKVKGMSCLDLTKDLEAILGGQIEAREITSEAHETLQTQVQEQQWQ